MFRGWVLGVRYHSWGAFKKAWNETVDKGLLFDDKGRKVTKKYQ